MRSILFLGIWGISVCSLGAANVLKEARAAIKSGSNLENTEKKLLETVSAGDAKYDKAELYFTAALVNKRINEQENEKLYLKQKYDTARFFNSIYNMFCRFRQCDSVEQMPDKNGRIKIRRRAKAREILIPYRKNLLNAGKFYMRKTNYKEAYRFLDLYLGTAAFPMFAGDDFARKDTLYTKAAYWATLSAYNQNDAKRTLKYMDEALKHPFQRFALTEYKAKAYKELGDTTAWVRTLEEGIKTFPDHSFFFTSLMDHLNERHEYEKALKFARRMVDFDRGNVLFRYAESVVLMNMNDYRGCIEVSDSVLKLDSVYTDAYYNKGISYYNLAMTKAETACTDVRNPQFRKDREDIVALYEQARMPMEVVRKLAPEDKLRWAPPLYAIYLYLNRGKDFAEIETILRSLNK
ncbi:MAG: hypothetical protein K2N13_02840 [Paraprevotella sp.]|nr:hypothetical protein [Paraprevotella sp.]